MLHQKRQTEQADHNLLSDKFSKTSTLQLNSYCAAVFADSKQCTLLEWQAFKECSSAPLTFDFNSNTKVVCQKDAHQLAILLESYCVQRLEQEDFPLAIVVKPDKGTEGELVEKFSIRALHDSAFFSCVRHIRRVIESGQEALLQAKRGNVLFLDPLPSDDDTVPLGPKEFCIGVFVEKSKTGFFADTGIAQVAPVGGFPASRGRGGSVVNVNRSSAFVYKHSFVLFLQQNMA